MRPLFILLFSAFSIINVNGEDFSNATFNYTGLTGFPKNFIFSTATASYQIEGAWNESGKGENIWDHLTHTRPHLAKDSSNGDIACDSYHLYKEDVQNIKAIGFKGYRFSLSWSRLFPTVNTSFQNPDGVKYYNNLIDELRSNGIEPMVTIYHWDLPQRLEDIGGWLNPDIAYYFADYARAVFQLFGDKVKWWMTINEPLSIIKGYWGVSDDHCDEAPCVNQHGVGEYMAAHNLVRAHAKAYRIYEKEFKPKQNGKVTIVPNGDFSVPKNASNPDHVKAAESTNFFYDGLFLHPIYKTGDYAPVVREIVDKNSKIEGRKISRLPYFTKEEIEEIKGSYDFMATNHYTTKVVEPGATGANPSMERDTNVISSPVEGAMKSQCSWVQVTPEGFRQYLNYLNKTYGPKEIFITEQGYCDKGGLSDDVRINYYSEYLRNLLLAINEDKINVIGYTTWSLMDNYEWLDGYTSKFGLMEVDFNSPNRTRTMKKSAYFIKGLIEKNKSNGAANLGIGVIINIIVAFQVFHYGIL